METRFYIWFSSAKPGWEALVLGSGWKGLQKQAEVSGTEVRLCTGSGRCGMPSCLLWDGHLSWVSEQASILHPLEGCLPCIPWTGDLSPFPTGYHHTQVRGGKQRAGTVALHTDNDLRPRWLLWRKTLRSRT